MTLLVLISLADNASSEGVAYPSEETIAAKSRISTRSVRRHLVTLKELGEVEVWEWFDQARRKRNCYRIIVGDLACYRGIEPEDIKEKAKILRLQIPTATRRRIFERDGWHCVQCGSNQGLTIDHIFPVSKGGGMEDENLQTLCAVHNREKADRTDWPVGHERPSVAGPDRTTAAAPERTKVAAPHARDPLKRNRHKEPSDAYASESDDPEHPPDLIPPIVILVGGRNLPLDALLEACHIGSDSKERIKGATVYMNGVARRGERGIRELFWLETVDWAVKHDDVPRLASLEPEEYEAALARAVARKAALYREKMPGATLSPKALRDYWQDLARMPAPRGRERGLTPEEVERMGRG